MTGGGGIATSPSLSLAVPLSTGAVQAVPNSTAVLDKQPVSANEVSIAEPTEIYQLADGRLVMGRDCQI